MPAQLRIPLEGRVQPTFFVVLPAANPAGDSPNLKSPRSRPFQGVPRGLSALLERHPAEIEVRIYDPGTAVDEWLAAQVAGCRGPQRLISVHTDDLNAHPRTGLWLAM